MNDQALLTVVEVARRLHVSHRTVREMLRNGELTSLVVGRRCRRVPVSAVERYIEARLSKGEERS